MSVLTEWASALPLLLAQAKEGAGQAAAKAPAGKAGEGGGGWAEGLFATPMLPVMLTLLLLYFLFLRPDPRKKKEAEQALANLKANDHVVTIGGICGVVVNLSKDTVTIRVDDKTGTKMKILRSAISRIGSPEEAADEQAKEAK